MVSDMSLRQDPFFEKQEAFEAAQELLSRNDDAVLRYAVLELRRCLEAIVYQKLKVYEEFLPPDSLRSWQPPQAFRALLRIEPDADESGRVAIAPEKWTDGIVTTGPFTSIGIDNRPKSDWLSKTWNKLGFFLHALSPFVRTKKGGIQREYLDTVLGELRRFVHGDVTVQITPVVRFNCPECQCEVIAGERLLEKIPEATCANCGAVYAAQKETEHTFRFFLENPTLECESCKKAIYVPETALAIGHRFSCRRCGQKYEIHEQAWGCRMISNEQTGTDLNVTNGEP
jgi:hypothetical protein